MVSRDRFAAMPLMPPGQPSSDARATGLVIANALRCGYTYAQTQGSIGGVQTYLEVPYVETNRFIETGEFSAVALIRKHVPPYARRIVAGVTHQIYTTGPADCIVYHRLTASYSGDTDVGPQQIDQVLGINSIYTDPTAGIFFYVDPINDIYGPYDLPIHQTECYVEFGNITPDANNVINITVEAYATRDAQLTATATESDRTSDIITATVPRGHHFSPQMQIWTEGFDEDVPQESPADVDSVTDDTVSWMLVGNDDGDFGLGVIRSTQGTPAIYRPGIISVWWET